MLVHNNCRWSLDGLGATLTPCKSLAALALRLTFHGGAAVCRVLGHAGRGGPGRGGERRREAAGRGHRRGMHRGRPAARRVDGHASVREDVRHDEEVSPRYPAVEGEGAQEGTAEVAGAELEPKA